MSKIPALVIAGITFSWWVFQKLIGDAVTSWVNSKIADVFGWKSPTVINVVESTWELTPLLLAIFLIGLYHYYYIVRPHISTSLSNGDLPKNNNPQVISNSPTGDIHDFNRSDWIGLPVYKLWEAACLWRDISPATVIDERSIAYPILRKIQSYIESGAIHSKYGSSAPNSKIDCGELRWVANKLNEKPEFLFRGMGNDPEFISLHDASVDIYNRSRLSSNKMLAEAAEKSKSGSPNDRLDYIARYISMHMSIHGKKHPSTVLEKIDQMQIKRSFFDEGATILRDNHYRNSIYWIDLCVKGEELRSQLATMEL